MFTKHFARIVCRQELENDDVELFFDIVQSVVDTKLITAYDEGKQEVGVEVISYNDEDDNGMLHIYEIILAEMIDEEEGNEISYNLFKEFDEVTFTFEASIEIQMKVTVLLIDDQYIAFDEHGAVITDRSILEQLSFEPFVGTRYVDNIQVDNNTDDAIITPLDININTTLHKR